MTMKDEGRPVVLVAHGYENIYERGFANGLSDQHQPFVLISSDRTDYRGLRPGTRTVNLRGSQDESRSKRHKLANLVRYHARLWLYAWRHRSCVFHTIGLIDPPLLYGVLEGLWLRLVTRRYVLTVHNLLPHDRETAANRWLFGMAFRLADRLVAHTERTREALVQRFGVDPSRVVVMEHGLEPQRQPALPLARYHAGEPLQLLFFGYIAPYKGLDLLLDALIDFPLPFVLTVAGRCGEAALAADLRRRIDAHPRRDSIRWTNAYVPEADIEPLFCQAHGLVMPYRSIDQSGVLFQALRFGLPVVATRVGTLERYVSEEVGETAPPLDSAAIGLALRRLAQRYEHIDRQQIMAHSRRFEWQNTVGVLHAVYQ